jgi:hypothetical protein
MNECVFFSLIISDLIAFLSLLEESFRVFLYLVKRYNLHQENKIILDDVCGPEKITPCINNNIFATSDYFIRLKSKLFKLSKIVIPIPIDDLGCTILLMSFARYYTRDRYPQFIYEHKFIKEIEIIETYIFECTTKTIKLPRNLCIDDRYGLLANVRRFYRTNYIRYVDVVMILSSVKSNNMTPKNL